jgi:hypothetical protein
MELSRYPALGLPSDKRGRGNYYLCGKLHSGTIITYFHLIQNKKFSDDNLTGNKKPIGQNSQ